MAKVKTSFFCQNCGQQFSKWQGQCSSCKQWNTIAEELIQKEEKKSWKQNGSTKISEKPKKISEIQAGSEQRIQLNDAEINRVLGGGLVPGSVVLIGGEPGIGKSTLILQLALNAEINTLYVTGEESLNQIKMRAERISGTNDNCFILSETKTQNIFKHIEELQPGLLVVDSIQTLHSDYIESSAGSISQIRECTGELIKFAKETNIPVIVIGHITKDGQIAGPKLLEHMVDCVLQFEGDQKHVFRILRAKKNRYGSTNELGIYEMINTGLRQVENPSEILISPKDKDLSGNAIAVTVEGMRPLMIEVQALVSTAVYGTPQRSSTGFNSKRLNMLLAVLEKKAGFRLGAKDVFLNITGGLSIDDPGIDLAVIAAILSSNEDISLDQNICFAAEVGLSGELRSVQRIEQRVIEASKLGFQKIFISQQAKIKADKSDIQIIKLNSVEEFYNQLFS